MLNVVLCCPEIPPNTGNIGRLCLAAGATLHLIEPLGFSLEEKALRRAGLDYWQDVTLRIWPDYASFRSSVESEARVHLFTTKTSRAYWDVEFHAGDYLVFGSETRGLPESLLRAHPDDCVTIPQEAGRSLNLATAAGIALYEAKRQLTKC